MEKELILLSNKKKYIESILNDTLDLRKKSKNDIINILKSNNYSQLENDIEYKYLLKMPMDSVSNENVNKIIKDYQDKETELQYYKTITEKELWISELQTLKDEYLKYVVRRQIQNH